MEDFTTIIHPADENVSANPDRTRFVPLFAKVGYVDGRLSITGVVGPRASGNCAGSCGQVIMSFKEYNKRGHMSLSDLRLAAGWTRGKLRQLFDVWDRWHLNDMKAACEHQRALGWTYEDHHDKATFQGEACPECGYKIGSAWLREDVPSEVVEFLRALPRTDKQPAWV